MRVEDFEVEFTPIPSNVSAWMGNVDAHQWRSVCFKVREQGGRLVALWGADESDGIVVYAALAMRSGLAVMRLKTTNSEYPDISDIFAAANRIQRANYDMIGLKATGARDQRKWLRHASWPETTFPLRKDFSIDSKYPTEEDNYPFVRVEGEGVHEIPVGPVHAGTIEPGHFRFSIIGERVLKLEERLGYKHKGIEKKFETMDLEAATKLAGRVSGDSTVAYAWAYAMAAEGATITVIPPRAAWLRGLFLERERIANHLGDLGFLGNDAGLAFGLAQFSILKETVLRNNLALFKHRYLMDVIVLGGVACDVDEAGAEQLLAEMEQVRETANRMREIYEEHAGLQDRFVGAGRVTPETATRLGLCGLAGRASSQAWDLRAQFPCEPYDTLNVNMATQSNGDVAARVNVRFDEILESLRLCEAILDRLPYGDYVTQLLPAANGAIGIGWVEGWRGEVLIFLQTGENNSIQRLHPHDPSWQNWPLIEYAIIDNIVPDFPLINKSFNLSYSGQDL